jgi:Ca-activated chloride channel homolog
MLRRLGRPEAVTALSSLKPGRRGRSRVLLLGAIASLTIAVAGPRWGKGEPGVVIGRDAMIVLDLSKSMLADDMRNADGLSEERWQAAKAGVHDLIESIRQRGGHRVGLVMFAAKPWVVCPLTSDYDHFLMRLDEFNPKAPPPELSPGKGEEFPSGTRIGAAIAEAVRWHDTRFPGYQDVLLISDGDDPADDREEEIEKGWRAALEAQIPVDTVGVGDPDHAVTVAFMRSDGEEEFIGPTQLVEAPLKEIARQSHGEYLRAGRDQPRLSEFFQARIEHRPNRELTDDALPQPHDRAVWFLLAALVLLLTAWAVES